MININEVVCPKCGGKLRYYDNVQRIVRTKGRRTKYIIIQRMRCLKCGSLHRELPEDILPYKQYEAEIIRGVLECFITSETIGYEDYPCERTMFRWITQNLHSHL